MSKSRVTRPPFTSPLDQQMLFQLSMGLTHLEAAKPGGYSTRYAVKARLCRLYAASGTSNLPSLIAWCFHKGYLKGAHPPLRTQELAAINHYRATLTYNQRRRRERLAEGKCTMDFGCNRPLATKYYCRYHADINSQSVMRSRRGQTKRRSPNGELNVGVAVRRYTRFVESQQLRRKRMKQEAI